MFTLLGCFVDIVGDLEKTELDPGGWTEKGP
jgi:hypothetical protein